MSSQTSPKITVTSPKTLMQTQTRDASSENRTVQPLRKNSPVKHARSPVASPLKQSNRLRASPLKHSRSPVTSPLKQSNRPRASPLKHSRSPVASPMILSNRKAASPLKRTRSPATSPQKQNIRPRVTALEQKRSPKVSPIKHNKSPLRQLEGSAVYMKSQIHPNVSGFSPSKFLTPTNRTNSPFLARFKTEVSPLNMSHVSKQSEKLNTSITPSFRDENARNY